MFKPPYNLQHELRRSQGFSEDISQFRKISEHFQKNSECFIYFQKVFQRFSGGHTNVSDHCPKLFQDFRSFPKISILSVNLLR